MDYFITATIAAQQQAIYRHILASFLSVEALPPGPVDAAVLRAHGIHAEKMAIVRMERVEPRFFEQLGEGEWQRGGFRLPAVAPLDWDDEPDEWLDTFAVTDLLDNMLTAGADEDDVPILFRAYWQGTEYPDDMDRRGTYEYEQFDDISTYEWRVVELWEPEDQAKPHLCVMSAHGHAVDDQQLLRSEVLALARLALYRLKERAADNHFITPIMMASVCGSKLRIIQSHFDGAQLVLRYAPLVDFRAAVLAPEKLARLLRSLVGHAVGNTKSMPRQVEVPGPPIPNELLKAANDEAV